MNPLTHGTMPKGWSNPSEDITILLKIQLVQEQVLSDNDNDYGCGHCNKLNQRGSKFCNECGYTLR